MKAACPENRICFLPVRLILREQQPQEQRLRLLLGKRLRVSGVHPLAVLRAPISI